MYAWKYIVLCALLANRENFSRPPTLCYRGWKHKNSFAFLSESKPAFFHFSHEKLRAANWEEKVHSGGNHETRTGGRKKAVEKSWDFHSTSCGSLSRCCSRVHEQSRLKVYRLCDVSRKSRKTNASGKHNEKHNRRLKRLHHAAISMPCTRLMVIQSDIQSRYDAIN